jgi:hypothetical protein
VFVHVHVTESSFSLNLMFQQNMASRHPIVL